MDLHHALAQGQQAEARAIRCQLSIREREDQEEAAAGADASDALGRFTAALRVSDPQDEDAVIFCDTCGLSRSSLAGPAPDRLA